MTVLLDFTRCSPSCSLYLRRTFVRLSCTYNQLTHSHRHRCCRGRSSLEGATLSSTLVTAPEQISNSFNSPDVDCCGCIVSPVSGGGCVCIAPTVADTECETGVTPMNSLIIECSGGHGLHWGLIASHRTLKSCDCVLNHCMPSAGVILLAPSAVRVPSIKSKDIGRGECASGCESGNCGVWYSTPEIEAVGTIQTNSSQTIWNCLLTNWGTNNMTGQFIPVSFPSEIQFGLGDYLSMEVECRVLSLVLMLLLFQ
jgi:hypothetical protein